MSESSKIKPVHTQRTAFVYIRQSSPSQVENNRESTARQYGLVNRACELGWPPEWVTVVDEISAFPAPAWPTVPASHA